MVRNGLRSHDLRLDATPPAAWGDRFTLRGRFTQPLLARAGDWRRWSGSLFADLPRADVRELRRYVTLPFELSEGDGALRGWFEVHEGQPAGGHRRPRAARGDAAPRQERRAARVRAGARAASTPGASGDRIARRGAAASASSPATASAGRKGDLSVAWRAAATART